MKKGFTILELLVASLLLGMLVTILTMIFNQSSIAWRTGVAGVADLDDVREDLANYHDEADNLYPSRSRALQLLSPWDDAKGEFRTRAISVEESELDAKVLSSITDDSKLASITGKAWPVRASGGTGTVKTYIVNVKSAGPDRELDTWDDIWSYPDDF